MQQRFKSMATFGKICNGTVSKFNDLFIFVMAWCWFNATNLSRETLAVILPQKKNNMTFEIIKSLLVPIIMIGFGIFIKKTENKNYQNVKKWWKILVLLE